MDKSSVLSVTGFDCSMVNGVERWLSVFFCVWFLEIDCKAKMDLQFGARITLGEEMFENVSGGNLDGWWVSDDKGVTLVYLALSQSVQIRFQSQTIFTGNKAIWSKVNLCIQDIISKWIWMDIHKLLIVL